MRTTCVGFSIVAALLASTTAFSATLADLVNQVSQAKIQGHVAALEGERATALQQAQAGDYIANQLQSYGYIVVRDPVGTSENIHATLSGSLTPSQTFVLGAHFDTVPGSPGADDNASGVAGMLEVARVLAGSSFASSIQFVAFGLEESGLIGSTQFAQNAKAAGRDLIGMISLEMIAYASNAPNSQQPFYDYLPCLDVTPEGVTVGNFIGVVGNTASAGLVSDYFASASAYVPARDVGRAQVLGNGTCFPDSRRSDHAPFWDRDYQALMITDTANYRNPNYHQAGDTLATLDLGFATDVTRATLGMVATRAGFLPSNEQVPALSTGGIALFALFLTGVGSWRLRRWSVRTSDSGH